MELREQINIALNLKNKLNFKKVNAFNINLYPLIRLSFFIHLIRVDYVFKHTFKKRLYELFLSCYYYFISNIKGHKLKPKFDNLFLTYSTFKRNKVNDKWFDLYVDSFILKNNLQDKSAILEVPQRGIYKNPKTFPSSYLNPFLQVKARLYGFWFPQKIKNLDFDTLNIYFKEYKYSMSEKKLGRKIAELNYYKKYFKAILLRHDVKKVYVTSFSMNFSMSLLWAANDLGLETFELQHGSVYENSPYYTNWNMDINYNLLPKYFLVWDNVQANYINSTNNNNFPIGIDDGNSFLEVFKNDMIDLTEYDVQWESIINNNNKTVLLILQREDIPGWLSDFIILNDNINWILRTHPGLNNDNYILNMPNISSILTHNHVFCNEFKNFILFYLLKKINCLVAWKSTTIIEASLFNKKSIMLTDQGIEYFQSLLDSKMLVMANKLETFQKALKDII